MTTSRQGATPNERRFPTSSCYLFPPNFPRHDSDPPPPYAQEFPPYPTYLSIPTYSSGTISSPESVASFTADQTPTSSVLPPPEEEKRVPRPPNAFILYRADLSRTLKAVGHAKQSQAQLSKFVGSMWREESAEVRAEWEEKARVVKAEHLLKHPEYKFKPLRKRSTRHLSSYTPSHSPSTTSSSDPLSARESWSRPLSLHRLSSSSSSHSQHIPFFQRRSSVPWSARQLPCATSPLDLLHRRASTGGDVFPHEPEAEHEQNSLHPSDDECYPSQEAMYPSPGNCYTPYILAPSIQFLDNRHNYNDNVKFSFPAFAPPLPPRVEEYAESIEWNRQAEWRWEGGHEMRSPDSALGDWDRGRC